MRMIHDMKVNAKNVPHGSAVFTEPIMKTKIITRHGQMDVISEKVLQLCFDEKSIDNFSPGLKMVFALEDPPLFVTLEEVENENTSSALA